jgi:hypothetical protein
MEGAGRSAGLGSRRSNQRDRRFASEGFVDANVGPGTRLGKTAGLKASVRRSCYAVERTKPSYNQPGARAEPSQSSVEGEQLEPATVSQAHFSGARWDRVARVMRIFQSLGV